MKYLPHLLRRAYRSMFPRINSLLITLAFLATNLLLPSTPASAASRIWCVNPAGGYTSSPCTNRVAFTTIQEAVSSSVSDNEVRIAQGTYTGSGTSVVTVVGRSLTFIGGFANGNWEAPVSSSGTVIDGQAARRGLTIVGDYETSISNIALSNGTAPKDGMFNRGGAIYASGTESVLRLTNTLVNNNRADNEGGGIYTKGVILLYNTRLTDNWSNSSGGGIHAGAVGASGSSFERNTGQLGGGGGILAEYADLRTSTFTANKAGQTGGAIFVSYDVGLEDSVLQNNIAGYSGGGLYQWSNVGYVDIAGSTIRGNAATQFDGGGVYVGGTAALTETAMLENSAGRNGGGIYQHVRTGSLDIENGRYDQNTSGGGGGGIYSTGPVKLFGVSVKQNEAGGSGGGIVQDNNPTDGQPYRGDFTALSSQFEANHSKRGSGGAISILGNAKLDLRFTSVTNNTAFYNGGGLFQLGQVSSVESPFEIQGGRFTHNIAQTSSGGGLSIRSRSRLRNMEITANEVLGTINVGGGIHIEDSSELVSILFASNVAPNKGEALYVGSFYGEPIAQVSLTNVTVTSAEQSTTSGIAIGSPSTPVSLVNTVVTNHAVGIERRGSSPLTGNYNAFFGNEKDQTVDDAAAPLPFVNLITADPQFVDPANNNFHITESSPLRNTGDPTRNYAGQFDFESQRVPVEGRADIGADEYFPVKARIYLPRIARQR